MSRILKFEERAKKEDSQSLNDFLEKAKILKEKSRDDFNKVLMLVDREKLVHVLEGRFFQELIKQKVMQNDIFFCSVYAAKTIVRAIKDFSPDVYLVDQILTFHETDNPFVIQRGGDACLLICALFPKRAKWRLMKEDYYKQMGSSFYYWFYSLTGREIGYHMGKNFKLVIKIVKSSIDGLD